MIHRMLLLSSLLFAAVVAQAGEPPAKLHLTGNSSVDFFSNVKNLPGETITLSDATQDEMSSSIGEEKSPWLGGVLSLAVPGAGEVYTQSYLKAALFAAVEATSWIVAYSYNKKGDRQTNDFHVYANQYWSASKYANWTLENLANLTPSPKRTQQEYGDEIYPGFVYTPGDPPSYSPPFSEMYWPALNAMEDDIRQAPENGYTHLLPPWGDQQYYELIGKYAQFRTGWDDDDLANGEYPRELPTAGHHMIIYRDMRAQANNYYDVASTFVSVAVVNHIVSAIDAFWSVTRYNKNLHAEVKMRVQPTRFGVIPIPEAKVTYTF